jgi:hypothetical protein
VALFQNGGRTAAAINLQVVVRLCLENGILAGEEGALPVAGNCSDDLNLLRTVDENVSFHCVFFNRLKKNLLALSQAITLDPQPTIANGQDGDRSFCLTLVDLFSQLMKAEARGSREEARLVN